MKDDFVTLIKKYREGNQECLLLIIEKLKPAIIKYARKLFLYDFEDAVSELELALLEAVNNILYVGDEKQCLTFLVNALRNKYWELARKSSKIADAELPLEEQCLTCPYLEYEYENCELWLDITRLLSTCSTKQKNILLGIFLDDKSSSQIAKELHITRQYTNRIKNDWLKRIEKEIFTTEVKETHEQ